MTKFEEEFKRPANGPLTELNNNMQEVFGQYRKMRQYADYLEYELKQKNEHILKLENENSFMRDERTTFDSNGNSVEPIIPQQALAAMSEEIEVTINVTGEEAVKILNTKEQEITYLKNEIARLSQQTQHSEPQLTIPKSIADTLDIAIKGLTEFEDYLWAVDEVDVLVPYDRAEYFRKWSNEEMNAHALAVSYVTGKALGVDLVKVVEG